MYNSHLPKEFYRSSAENMVRAVAILEDSVPQAQQRLLEDRRFPLNRSYRGL